MDAARPLQVLASFGPPRGRGRLEQGGAYSVLHPDSWLLLFVRNIAPKHSWGTTITVSGLSSVTKQLCR